MAKASIHFISEHINEVRQPVVNFPMIEDEDKAVSKSYDIIHSKADNNLTLGSVFIIAPDKTVKLILTYPVATGRNCYELLRLVDSL